jgi:hypothetical protein
MCILKYIISSYYINTMADLKAYYRTFLQQPYRNANYLKGSGKQSGGSINRFGSTLSGNANQHVLYGSPTGGAEGVVYKNRDPNLISGPYNSNIYGSGQMIGNELTQLTGKGRSSNPKYWGKVGQDYHGQGKLQDAYINPQTLHAPSPYGVGSRIF